MPDTAQMARSHKLESAETESRIKQDCQKKKRINEVIPGNILPCLTTGALSSLHQRGFLGQQIRVDIETHRRTFCGEKVEIASLHCDTSLEVRRILLKGHVRVRERLKDYRSQRGWRMPGK